MIPPHGQPACSPWRLALVTILHVAEGRSDRHAAHAVRRCLDWTAGLRRARTAPGCDASVRSACRPRWRAGAAEYRRVDPWLNGGRDRPWGTARGRQRTDATHLRAAVRALNRIEVVGEPLRHALHRRAVGVPAWGRPGSPPDWQAREARRAEEDRLPTTPTARAARVLTSGDDGWRVRSAGEHAESP
jgi:transposase